MTAIPDPSTTSPTRAPDLQDLAGRVYDLLTSGHDALAYSVDARGPWLTEVGSDGRRACVSAGTQESELAPDGWRRAREIRGGREVDRRFNAWVLAQHLRGKYAVAPASPGWVEWVALDIDAHAAPGEPELVGRRLARARADKVLASVWRSLGCDAERQPVILRSPRSGYHLWFPLTRGPASSNREHSWPASVARAWFERHLNEAGIELAPGVLEIYPSGRVLRAPCGLGMQLLRATHPEDPDALGLEPWPGTMATERVDWRGVRDTLTAPVRRVVPLVVSFLAEWERQRRPIAEWLGRPDAGWDPAWGFLGWRKKNQDDSGDDALASQQTDDVPGGAPVRPGRRAPRRPVEGMQKLAPTTDDPDVPPTAGGGRLVRGQAFKVKVTALLERGVTLASTRHDAVLTLAFYWGATCGLSTHDVLARLTTWCKAHPHDGSRLAARPRAFLATCVREARHYLEHNAAKWRFRARGDAGGRGTLAPADQCVLNAVDPRVRREVAALLAWLAGRADRNGRVAGAVELAGGLCQRLCGGDRRIATGGQRRRAVTMAIEELERLGILTLFRQYLVGQHGRMWCCWYRFGSGQLAPERAIDAAIWTALGGGDRAQAASSSQVVARVLAERVVPEGLLRILSDGARGRARSLLDVQVGGNVAGESARAPWFVRMFERRSFTPGEAWDGEVTKLIPFPDVEARRRLPRRERLEWGTGTIERHGPAEPTSERQTVAFAAWHGKHGP